MVSAGCHTGSDASSRSQEFAEYYLRYEERGVVQPVEFVFSGCSVEVLATGSGFGGDWWRVREDASGVLLMSFAVGGVWEGKSFSFATSLDGLGNLEGFGDSFFNDRMVIPVNVSLVQGGPLWETCSGNGLCQVAGVDQPACICDDGFLGALCEEAEPPPVISYVQPGGAGGVGFDGSEGDGSAAVPFASLRSALSSSDASGPRMLMLLPGRYKGRDNTLIKFEPVETLENFPLPTARLVFNSTHGAAETVVDCESATSFLQFNSGAAWYADVTLERITMHNCTTPPGGTAGPLTFQYGAGNILLRDMVFSQNVGYCRGGAVHLSSCSAVTLLGCRFEANRVYHNFSQSSQLLGGMGGGLYALNSEQLIVRGSEFLSNWAQSAGGAINANELAGMTLEQVVLAGNVADLAGGALFVYRGIDIKMIDTLIANNTVSSTDDSQGIFSFLKNNAGCGGGIMFENSNADMRNMELSGNEAQIRGGGLYSSSDVNLKVDGVLMSRNRCAGAGGALSLITTDLTLANTQITSNAVLEVGGALECTQGIVRLDSGVIDVSRNNASRGGGMYLYSCDLDVQKLGPGEFAAGEMQLEGNIAILNGGALFLIAGSKVRLPETFAMVFRHNVVSREGEGGGGLHSSRGCEVHLVGAAFLGNLASKSKGGALYSEGGLVNITGTRFEGNSAMDGAAVALVLETRADGLGDTGSRIESSTFEAHLANRDGAVFHVARQEESQGGLPILAELSLTGNVAKGGGHLIFWDPGAVSGAKAEPLRCQRCIDANNTAAYSTESGLAAGVSRLVTEPVHAKEETGGEVVAQAIVVDLVDMFNQSVVTDSSTLVYAESVTAACKLSGTARLAAETGKAVFDSMALVGSPGTRCEVVFTATGNTGDLATGTAVMLRMCEPGEYLNGMVCVQCLPGQLSFDNESACEPCDLGSASNDSDVDLWCPGGAQYAVNSGRYVAPSAAGCGANSSAARCLLDRVYECINEGACDADLDDDDARVGSSADDVASLQLCDLNKFGGGLICGGGMRGVCSNDHFSTFIGGTATCQKCPSRGVTITLAVISGVLTALFAFLLALLCYRVSLTKKGCTPERMKSARILNRARITLSLVIGHLQVFGQLQTVYGEASVPAFIGKFSARFDFLNMSPQVILNTECLAYHFSDISDTQLFWTEFYSSAFMPLMLPAFIGVLCALFIRWGQRSLDDESLRREFTQRAATSCFALIFFLLMLLHPGISTTMFLVFRCEKYHYEEDHTQWWLSVQNSIECYTTMWWISACVASFCVATFSIGFPLAIFISMRHLRGYVHVRMRLVDALRRMRKISSGAWIPTTRVMELRLEDKSASFRGKRKTRVSRIGIGMKQALTRAVSNAWNDIFDTDDADSTDSELAMIELYIPKSDISKEFAQKSKLENLPTDPTDSATDAVPPLPEEANSAGVELHEKSTTRAMIISDSEDACAAVLEVDGESLHIAVFSKLSMMDGSDFEVVPVTRLDGGEALAIFGQAHEPYEDSLEPVVPETHDMRSGVLPVELWAMHYLVQRGVWLHALHIQLYDTFANNGE
ncbi:hypothetical protein CYMTET_25746 [Cymbomonas tetramitiformis]|uniref:EGF-like domain-containing protein n=1 Tax=Cymbomonas tetramitiformis TaxID=36881 RepID=A0AAE0KYX5_9CHLO|nr:hypothetical protein CYMTET_25746 [Cymbomonas tetramitiformis]